jgi:competence protein ComFC
MLEKILNLIFPPRCLGCGKNTRGAMLCEFCTRKITLHQTLFCGQCGLRLAEGKRICHKDFPYLLGAATDFDNDIVRNAIHALKFQYVKNAADALGGILVHYAAALHVPFDDHLVIPIPLSPRRLRERGFNQSELLANIFARGFGLRMETEVLARVKNTKPQSETKNAAERRENLARSFAIRHPEFVAGKNIILIDDVTTSGATLFEAATVLKTAGAKKIIALAVARA